MTESEAEIAAEGEEALDDELDDAFMARPSILNMDFRIMWIQDRVIKCLGISGHELLFYKLLNANNRHFEDKLLNFLILDLYGVTDLERKVVFFYCTYYTEAIQEEVPIWERRQIIEDRKSVGKKRRRKKSKSKIPKVDPLALLSQIDDTSTKSDQKSMVSAISDDDPEEAEEGGEEEEGEGEEGGEDEGSVITKETGSGDTMSRKTEAEEKESVLYVPPPPGEEDNYIMSKKMVEKVRRVPILHMVCGDLNGSKADLQDTTLFYFLRTTDEGIPNFDSYKECQEEITNYLVVGTLQGKFLLSMNRLLVEVFKPLVDTQFRGPQYVDSAPHRDDDSDSDGPPSLTDIMVNRSSIFRRPSEFRRISIVLAKKEAKGEEDEKSDEDEDEDQNLESIILKYKQQDRTPSKVKGKRKMQKTSTFYNEPDQPIEEEPPHHLAVNQHKNDVLAYLDKLIHTVEWTLEHIEGDILLTMPNIPELEDPKVSDEMLLNNKEIVDDLENVLMSWGVHIQKVLESFQVKMPDGKGPLAECDYWQDREIGLLMLVEQLRTPMAKRILNLLNTIFSPIASNFEYFYSDLWKFYTEARDNNRFLETLIRHFKLMTESDCFKTINQAISPLMEGIRMIWILSSYYSTEEKMMGLMERISWQLCQNVIQNLSINELFQKPLLDILHKTEEAHTMLKNWKESYLRNREDIELSGKGMRWEFDQKRLFQGTEYIASVCDGLNQVANVLQDFHNIFGPYLKTIINDPAQIDTIIKRVDRLTVTILDADYNIFDEFNKENWLATMSLFYEEVRYLENEAKFFIDECFMALTNAEDALQMLLKFKEIKTRASIHERLMKKFDVIMQQFSKEVSIAEGIFNRGKRQPPLLTYHPPMAGAIYWARQLFNRLRGSVLILQNVSELKHSKLKLLAFSQYHELGKQLKAFEQSKYNTWSDKAQFVVINTMKKSVLKMVRIELDKGSLTFSDDEKNRNMHMVKRTRTVKDFESPGSTSQVSVQKGASKLSTETDSSGGTKSQMKPDLKGRDQKYADSHPIKKLTWTEYMSGSIMVECHLRFQVNFDWEVFEIIHEAELMEQLGFELSPMVKDASTQKNRLRSDFEVMERIINQYNEMLDNMDKADIQLFKTTLMDVEKHIQPGLTRFNWNSLNISDYAQNSEKLLKTLSSLVDQANHMKHDLDNRINSELQTYNLFSLPTELYDQELMPCKTYFQEIQSRRTELVSAMTSAYQSISPVLIKLESLILGTSTGKSPAMELFYDKYEKKIFSAFVMCMLKNLEYFNKTIMGNVPLFQVDAILIASEAVLRPSPGEVYSIILQNVRNLFRILKLFPRWMNGTCLECKPQRQNDHENLTSFTFFEDVMSIQVVNDNILMVQRSAHKIALESWHYLHRWKKYSNLWSFDKNLAAEKYVATEPTLSDYDEKFTFYDNILEEVAIMEPHYNLHCIRINLNPLLAGIRQHANEWKQVLGNFLMITTISGMNDLHMIIEGFRNEVELVITGLDRFTSVMQAISDIKKSAVRAEVRYTTYEVEQETHNLRRDWESLYLGALYRASTLESTCDRFSEMTQDQINDFVAELEEFSRDFEENGPGSVGENLELGLRKMDEYGKLIVKLDERRENLINSEILFDLPATDYSVFLNVKKCYDGMGILYELYKEQKNMRNVWAQTLWVNLNPQQLIDGMDHFIREYRKLPKFVKSLGIGQALDDNMKNFKNSVPLFIELKNEAMRERHWKQLMKKTGRFFDMDPDRCEDDEQ